MLSIAVCDDDKSIHEKLSELLLSYSVRYNQDFDMKHFYKAEELMDAPFDYDILFLDIMLNDNYDGLRIGKKLRKMKNRALYIIITSREDCCVDAFEATTFRYLLKPLVQDSIDKILKDALEFMNDLGQYLKISFKQNDYYIHIMDIIFIESYMRKRYIYTKSNTFQTVEKLKSLQERLINYHFFTKIGKTHFINMIHIQSTAVNSITLDNGQSIKLNEHAQNTFHNDFNIFLSNGR